MKRIIVLAILLSQAIFNTAAYGHETEEAQNALQMCTECKGTGIGPTCPLCKGTGTISIFNGFFTMSMRCTGCNGSGKFPCTTCNGTGKIRPIQQQQTSVQDNQYTPITGNSNAVSNRVMCTTCNGTGLCPSCKGNHTTTCKYCEGRGKTWYGSGSNARYETCAVCNGSGKTHCPICVRSNYHNPGKCEVCKGKGYVN